MLGEGEGGVGKTWEDLGPEAGVGGVGWPYWEGGWPAYWEGG